MKISIFKEDLNNTSFYIYGYCSELYRMTFHEIYPKNHPFLCSGASRPQSELFFYCKQANLQKLKINFKSFTLLQHLALFDISIWHIDCRYIDTFEKYRYRYGEVENIDIDIDIDMGILKISISIKWFWKISISIKQFQKYRYRYWYSDFGKYRYRYR